MSTRLLASLLPQSLVKEWAPQQASDFLCGAAVKEGSVPITPVPLPITFLFLRSNMEFGCCCCQNGQTVKGIKNR